MKPFKAIAAMSENRVIGAGGKLPWHIPEDLRMFMRTTMDGALVMGRRTWESIGRELPGRLIVILTSRPIPIPANNCLITPSLDIMRAFAMDFDDKQFWIVGGARLFKEMLPECEELYLTRVKAHHEGDTFMPPFEHLFTRDSSIGTPAFAFEHWQRNSTL